MRYIGTIGALALLAGCGGSDAPSGQVVATVNGDEITRGEMNAGMPGNAPSDPRAAARVRNAVLEQLVGQRLVVQEAKRQNLDKSQPYLLAMRRAEGQILADLLTQGVFQGLRTPDDAAIDAFIAANPTRFAQRVVFRTDQLRAPAAGVTAAALADAHSLDAVRARLRVDDGGVERRSISVDSLTLAPAATRQLLALPPGEPFVVTEGPMLLASTILSAERVPLTGDEARKAAIGLMKQEAGTTALRRQYEELRKAAAVQYQDGFGPPPAATTPSARPSAAGVQK